MEILNEIRDIQPITDMYQEVDTSDTTSDLIDLFSNEKKPHILETTYLRSNIGRLCTNIQYLDICIDLCSNAHKNDKGIIQVEQLVNIFVNFLKKEYKTDIDARNTLRSYIESHI